MLWTHAPRPKQIVMLSSGASARVACGTCQRTVVILLRRTSHPHTLKPGVSDLLVIRFFASSLRGQDHPTTLFFLFQKAASCNAHSNFRPSYHASQKGKARTPHGLLGPLDNLGQTVFAIPPCAPSIRTLQGPLDNLGQTVFAIPPCAPSIRTLQGQLDLLGQTAFAISPALVLNT